jgi:hypothetical protein
MLPSVTSTDDGRSVARVWLRTDEPQVKREGIIEDALRGGGDSAGSCDYPGAIVAHDRRGVGDARPAKGGARRPQVHDVAEDVPRRIWPGSRRFIVQELELSVLDVAQQGPFSRLAWRAS